MALFLRQVGRQVLLRQPSCLFGRKTNMATRPTAYEEMSHYWEKNRNLGRPLSPHLTVFKPHLTMVISITNRIAAVALTSGICFASITMLCLPGNYETYLKKLSEQRWSRFLFIGIKILMAFPFAYHLVAGLRHLIWDLGYGFSKPATYRGGWVILGLSLILTACLM